MLRVILAYALTLVLSVTSLSFAYARGTNPEFGTDIIICSGVGITTITIGADGQPIETTHICPDGSSIFAAVFSLPIIAPPTSVLVAWLAPAASTHAAARPALSPSARGSPVPS